jgi:hypothetical protein
MSDTSKREPSLDPRAERGATYFPPPNASPAAHPAPAPSPNAVPLSDRGGLDQLSRIEEKSARIEEKFARTEALLLRVEATFQDALNKFGGIARTTDVAALEERVRRLPGAGAIFIVALIASIIGAAAMLYVLRYGIPGVMPAMVVPH